MEIVSLLASSEHRYEGRPKDGPLPAREVEARTSIEIRAGLGVVGDRYFGAKAHAQASVTLFAIESLEAISDGLDPLLTRRNIVLRGLDVDALRGQTFSLDTGSGPVAFRANRPANPCAWMDEVLVPGAFRALRGRGGMRCEPLTDGVLSLGTFDFRLLPDPADR